MAAAVGCSDQTDVRVIPGNHDVDRSQIDYFCETAHERLRDIDPDKLDRELAKMAKAKEESNPLLVKLQNYRIFASRYGCDFNPVERLSWRKTYEFDANHRFEILRLTSVLVCDGNDAKDLYARVDYKIGDRCSAELCWALRGRNVPFLFYSNCDFLARMWPYVVAVPKPAPAQAWLTRSQHELFASDLPSRSQWNCTFTRPYSSV